MERVRPRRPPRPADWETPLGEIEREALALPRAPGFLFRFAVYGDNQRGVPVHRRIVEAILLSGAEVVLHTGDYVQDGERNEQWDEQFLLPARPLLGSAVFLGVLGNHDRNSPRYYEILRPPSGKPWFRLDHRGVACFGLDTTQRLGPVHEQIAWLDGELKDCRERWKVVFLHEAPFSSSWPWPGGSLRTRKWIMPILEKYHVDLVFAGHIHNYERFHKAGIAYLITGGGGDTLSKPEQLPNPYTAWTLKEHNFCTADVFADRIEVRARDTRGVPFDGISVRGGGEITEAEITTRRRYDGPRSNRRLSGRLGPSAFSDAPRPPRGYGRKQ